MKFFIYLPILILVSVFVVFFNPKESSFDKNGVFFSFPEKENGELAALIPRPGVNVKPEEARGIYLTVWTFVSPSQRNKLVKLADETEINSLVINIKDSDGITVYSLINNESLVKLIDELHSKNIYLIGRIAVFEDKDLVRKKPELSLKYSDGKLWRDQGGYWWVDPASKEVWDYTVNLSKQAIDLGFDEIQLDYIRFPSEGKLEKAIYPFYDSKTKKSEVIDNFMKYFHDEIKNYSAKTIISADIFGYTFLRGDDLGIGQILLNILNHFDFVSPMVYPSHYKSGNFGFKNPAEFPYEVIKNTLEEGIKLLVTSNQEPVTSSPSPSPLPSPEIGSQLISEFKSKIRPWLQDFNLGAIYDADKIKLQKKAVYDFGVNTWMLWNPNNVYTSGGLEKE